MSEQVQRLLEDMVPELEDLQRRKLFTKPEISAIVNKRRAFEYRLLRRVAGDGSGAAHVGSATNKLDFLRYIEYELNLDQLRAKRKQRFGIVKGSISDHSIARHVHFLYDRMLRKYSDDLGLWRQWIQYCVQTDASRTLSKVFPRALQLHPTCTELWARAALWEYTANANVDAARVLFQRSLRLNPHSAELWLAFYAMELKFVAKLAKRKRVLGLAPDPKRDAKLRKAEADAKAEGRGERAGADIMSLDELPSTKLAGGAAAEADAEADERARFITTPIEEKLFDCAVPRAIFANAIAQRNSPLATDYAFRIAFFERLPKRARVLQTSSAAAAATPAGKKSRANGAAGDSLIRYSALLNDIDASIARDFAAHPIATADRAHRARNTKLYAEPAASATATAPASAKAGAAARWKDAEAAAWAVFEKGIEAAAATAAAPAATASSSAAATATLSASELSTALWHCYAYDIYTRITAYTERLQAGGSGAVSTPAPNAALLDNATAAAAAVAPAESGSDDDEGADHKMAAATTTAAAGSGDAKGSAAAYRALIDHCVARGLDVCDRADDSDSLCEPTAALWVQLLLQAGKTDEAREKLEEVLEEYPQSVSLWRMHLRLLTPDAATKAYPQALSSVALDDPESWSLCTDWIASALATATASASSAATAAVATRRAGDTTFVALLQALGVPRSARAGERDAQHTFLERAKLLYVQWAVATPLTATPAGALGSAAHRTAFRGVCDVVLFSAPVTWAGLLHPIITIELVLSRAANAGGAMSAADQSRIRLLFERAVRDFGGASTAVWKDAIAFERGVGAFPKANALYQRAIKQLNDPYRSQFITEHSALAAASL